MERLAVTAAVVLALTTLSGMALADTTLTIESWRNDDADVWTNQIIPAFEKQHPDIKVTFNATAPTEYNAALNSRLEGGTAGDLITCRPFDASLSLFDKGFLTPVNDVKGMENFSDVAKSAWTTDDGKTTFCVPMASVIHGFIYNEDAFKKMGEEPPKTMEVLHAEKFSYFLHLLDKIKYVHAHY